MFELVDIDLKKSYYIEEIQAETALSDFFVRYVDIEGVEELCKPCDNYGKSWECPPHCEDITPCWKSHENIRIIGWKLNYCDDLVGKKITDAQKEIILDETLRKEKLQLKKKLIKLEQELNGVYLYGGRCDNCRRCNRSIREPCRFPDKQRYSLESIGCYVVDVAKVLLNTELLWIEDNIFPHYLLIVTAVLYD